MEASEIEKATVELNKAATTDTVYKSAGSILVKTTKVNMLKELSEKKEITTTRSMVLAKQEVRLRANVKELQGKLDQAIQAKSLTKPSES